MSGAGYPKGKTATLPLALRLVYEKLKALIIYKCSFVNLPETSGAGWGEILDEEKMKQCVWVVATATRGVEEIQKYCPEMTFLAGTP